MSEEKAPPKTTELWKKARKKPIEVEFREPIPDGGCWETTESIRTLEGTLVAKVGRDYVVRGVQGELYPIRKDIFHETYEVIEP